MPERKRLPHLFIRDAAQTENYVYPGGGGRPSAIPERDRQSHARHLLRSLETAKRNAGLRRQEAKAWAVPEKGGVHLEFESEPDFDLELDSLDSRRPNDVQLVNVRSKPGAPDTKLATVFVPAGKLHHLESKLEAYASEDTPKGRPKHQKLVEKISQIRLAQLQSFWTDSKGLPPVGEAMWWEVWLRRPEDEMLERFQSAMEDLGVTLGEGSLAFPSTRVVLAYGTLEQFSQSVEVVDSIAELRQAKEAASFFLQQSRGEMAEWVSDLLSRTRPPRPDAPCICILDTGVNAGHPLLQIAVSPSSLQSVDPSWGVNDHDGHGTGMAGLALYGDLTPLLTSSEVLELVSRLESVKILPPNGENHPSLYGYITEQAIYRAEVEEPRTSRVICMAITATDGRERGRPSSWSAAVDQLAFGGEDGAKRLIVLSAGNSDPGVRSNHPAHLDTEEIEDPGQAWNALTVGAFTDRWQIDESDLEGWAPLAQPGDLSPSTTTSSVWQSAWSMKPDVVAEGGNAALSPSGETTNPDSLSLLTTHRFPTVRLLTTFGDTSAACALVSKTVSELQFRYPDLWPETIRALVVHSAVWTHRMLQQYGPITNKTSCEEVVRRCGFGVPDLERAVWSADNHLTLLVQEDFRPFDKKKGSSSATLKDLQFFRLPWPIEQLRDLGEAIVQLRVTLSYFIEPNPSERGYRTRHRYQSHGFRFDVRAATETFEDFRKRLTKDAREDGEGSPGTSDTSGWTLGSDRRHRGSIHSDIWKGTAAELADRHDLAVYPVSGWWKERHQMERWKRSARYALIVSILAPEIEVDLYTPVSTSIQIPISVLGRP